jgi:hypothetical protein
LATVWLVIVSRRCAEESIKEARRIGEAQTRAYVNVKSVGISFEGRDPAFGLTIVNSGQSPALNFIWNVLLKFQGHPLRDDQKWLSGRLGVCMARPDSSFVVDRTRSRIMAGWRQVVELAMSDEEIAKLAVIARTRSETARRVERVQMLLNYRENPSFFAVGQRLGVHHHIRSMQTGFLCRR